LSGTGTAAVSTTWLLAGEAYGLLSQNYKFKLVNNNNNNYNIPFHLNNNNKNNNNTTTTTATTTKTTLLQQNPSQQVTCKSSLNTSKIFKPFHGRDHQTRHSSSVFGCSHIL
jgi:hypothetical protein